MSILSEKYNIPEDTIKKMIKDGVVSCSWNVYDTIARMRKEGKSWDDVAFETGMTVRNCHYILEKGK